jgi:hypothetical protein
MNVSPIGSPLPGEVVVGVEPPLAAEVDSTWWRRRLNLFTGRALSDIALRAEQDHRAGRIATLGQSVSAGVVGGLNVDVRVERDTVAAPYYQLYVSPGVGIAAGGEDVTVARPMRVNVRDVPVYSTSSDVTARTLGELLDQLRTDAALPIAGVVALQPITAELRDDLDKTDPCDQDAQNEAFEDWQVVDGCRLRFFVWPHDWVAMPVGGLRWRNVLAQTIFDREMRLGPDEVPPWAEIGIPIALVAFAADVAADAVEPWAPVFVDRFAVVRAGGKPRGRQALVPGSGNKFLWQARIEQLAEHVADLGRDRRDIGDIAKEFRFAPPVGLLPKEALDAVEKVSRFFPSWYAIEAVPIPMEQLDAAVRASASMEPFDLSVTDRVRMLVPVPQVFYEPRLLEVEAPDASFGTALGEFVATRAEWLQRRENVREKATAIFRALKGDAAPAFPPTAEDPEALEPAEDVREGPLDPDEGAYGTGTGPGGVVATAYTDLVNDLRASAPWNSVEVSTALDALPPGLVLPAALPEAFTTRIRYDAARQLLFLKGATSTEERELLQALPAGDGPWEAAIGRLHVASNEHADFVALARVGVDGFIPYLDGKIRRADDRIDFGFLRVQTDIYRLRQVMLGTTEATRLATSPVLAGIAKGETAIATREDMTRFFDATKRGKEVTRPEGSGTDDEGFIAYVRALGTSTRGLTPPDARTTSRAADRSLAGETGASGVSAAGRALTGALTANVNLVEVVRTRPATGIIGDGGLVIDRGDTLIEAVDRQGAGAALPVATAPPVATMDDITQQPPIVGEVYDFRTTTVAKRIESPPALEAKSFSVAAKFDVTSGLQDLDIAIADVPVAGLGATATFGEITGGRLNEILKGAFDPDPANGDEADFVGSGVKALDDAVVTLRAVEGRVQQYRVAMEKCRKAAATLRELSINVDRRLKEIADSLTEARHDVAVARALLAEEIARVEGVNNRREEILANHVPFIAYLRPRLVEAVLSAPIRVVNPGLVEAPVPVCMARDVEAPPELRGMVDLLREVPVRWYVHVRTLLGRFDRLDLLHGAVLNARTRAAFKVPGEAVAVTGIETAGKLGKGVFNAFAAQQRVLSEMRVQTAQLDLTAFVGLSWQQSRDRAEDVLSLGDLVDGGHGRTDVAQVAAREIEQISRVASCLYAAFGDVLPRIRLDWAERLSQYDDPVTLRNLATLPRWGEVEYLERREMQALVDWLYSRVDAVQPGAVGLISDLVRICILLASHAPVGQIIAGHVPKPTVVTPGRRVELNVDLTKVRVGMQVLMYEQQTVVARGVVQDLTSGMAAAHILETSRPSVTLPAGARVQFAAASNVSTSARATPAAPGKR